jgi:hypothetical protein
MHWNCNWKSIIHNLISISTFIYFSCLISHFTYIFFFVFFFYFIPHFIQFNSSHQRREKGVLMQQTKWIENLHKKNNNIMMWIYIFFIFHRPNTEWQKASENEYQMWVREIILNELILIYLETLVMAEWYVFVCLCVYMENILISILYGNHFWSLFAFAFCLSLYTNLYPIL